MPKKTERGTPHSLAQYCMFHEKRKKNLVQFTGPSGSNFVLLVELFWSLQVYRKTRRERLKVGVIFKAQKAQSF